MKRYAIALMATILLVTIALAITMPQATAKLNLTFTSINASDSSGTVQSTFVNSATVYARIVFTSAGSGTIDPSTIRVYIVTSTPANGASLTDARGTYTTVTMTATSPQIASIWLPTLTAGSTYYLVADCDNNGVYNTAKDKISPSSFSVTPPPIPTIESSDGTATEVNEFTPASTVYAYGSGFTASANLNIYIVNHKDTWTSGDTLTDVRGAPTAATADSTGNLAVTQLWTNPQPGKYDIIADQNNNGQYDANEAIDYADVTINGTTGFFVLPEYAFGALGALGACFAGFVIVKKPWVKSNP